MVRSFKKILVENKESILKAGTSVFKYRNEIRALLKNVEWKDITEGKIVIKEEMLNNEIKSILLKKLDTLTKDSSIDIKDINAHIEEGFIVLKLEAKYKLINIKKQYKVIINKFAFKKNNHKAELEYKELSNIGDSPNYSYSLDIFARQFYIAFIEAIFKLVFGSIEKRKIDKMLSNKRGIVHEDGKLIVDLDDMPQFYELEDKKIMGKSILDLINLELVECRDHKLIFKVKLID